MHYISFGLLAIGGLNWLITGLYSAWNLGNYITPLGAQIVYVLVGLAAIYEIVMHAKNCKACGKKESGQMPGQSQM